MTVMSTSALLVPSGSSAINRSCTVLRGGSERSTISFICHAPYRWFPSRSSPISQYSFFPISTVSPLSVCAVTSRTTFADQSQPSGILCPALLVKLTVAITVGIQMPGLLFRPVTCASTPMPSLTISSSYAPGNLCPLFLFRIWQS